MGEAENPDRSLSDREDKTLAIFCIQHARRELAHDNRTAADAALFIGQQALLSSGAKDIGRLAEPKVFNDDRSTDLRKSRQKIRRLEQEKEKLVEMLEEEGVQIEETGYVNTKEDGS